MRRFNFLIFIVITVCSHAAAQGKTNEEIKKIDFRNFEYKLLNTRNHGWDKPVKVKNGEFYEGKKDELYKFSMAVSVLYGDLNYDNNLDAVVIATYQSTGANWDEKEILFYTMINHKPVLIADLDLERLKSDYNMYFPNSTLWPTETIYQPARRNTILVKVLADGNHAQAEYKVFMEYEIRENQLQLIDKPVRDKF